MQILSVTFLALHSVWMDKTNASETKPALTQTPACNQRNIKLIMKATKSKKSQQISFKLYMNYFFSTNES